MPPHPLCSVWSGHAVRTEDGKKRKKYAIDSQFCFFRSLQFGLQFCCYIIACRCCFIPHSTIIAIINAIRNNEPNSRQQKSHIFTVIILRSLVSLIHALSLSLFLFLWTCTGEHPAAMQHNSADKKHIRQTVIMLVPAVATVLTAITTTTTATAKAAMVAAASAIAYAQALANIIVSSSLTVLAHFWKNTIYIRWLNGAVRWNLFLRSRC